MTTALSQGEFNIDRMCWLAGVSRASYYRHWLDSAPRRAETGLRDLIQKLALGNAHYGYRRIAALLRREGWQVNHKCVLRIMREDNLLCLRASPFVPVTTNSRHGWQVVPNLARGMILNGVNQLWVADITFLHLAEEFAFLAVVLDAYSRKVVGWALDTHLRASLAIEAIEMAIADRQPEPGSLVHHSDRGVQYACGAYSELLHRRGIQASMSRVGNPYACEQLGCRIVAWEVALGIMSEAELHQIRIRLHQGDRQKAARGELRIPLPGGLTYNRSGQIVFNLIKKHSSRRLMEKAA
ncbi:IS3 family transposase [Mesorhizobium sp. YC-39]|uniref:IS3 family transposase n=1 Tax=unclassified Mesorhizobium TaxID=325217 RepID=UPI0021E76D80|nr:MULTISPECIES: IS3 family transposase [unclassified Mesorhizobium]MCV3211893.1 IS3 family transposase [Mesorhizobium sp. YC-2]MCV3233616.1 IS3 family transposase [Mesorhizobium sp. YC-39]